MKILSKILHPIWIMGFILSCSHQQLPADKWDHEYRDVDYRLMHLVKRIEGYAGYRMPFLKIRLVKFPQSKTAGGLCHMYTRQISLPIERWFKYSEVKQETILLHEIGHCVFGKKHIYHKDPKRCPYSLMNWQGVPDRCYKK